MKQIKVEKYNELESGETYLIQSMGFRKDKDKTMFGPIAMDRGILKNCSSKVKEIKEDGEYTGRFEEVGDTICYERIDESGKKESGYHYTTIGCGMFRVFEEN